MREIFHSAVAAKTFRGKALLRQLVPALTREPELHAAYNNLDAAWPDEPIGRETFMGIVRWSFLIELVKTPKIETTKFEVRWAQRLGETDPRFASYEDCVRICIVLATEAVCAAGDQVKRNLLEAFYHRNLVPYELPLDYKRREKAGRLHAAANVEWLWGGAPRQTVLLRDFLLSDRVGAHRKTFNDAYNKIKVKTNLTDRVQTGTYKTNREKRWETHPASVHYALHRDCLEIEYALMEQISRFDGFPKDIRDTLVARGIVDASGDQVLCPITFEPLSFLEFEKEIRNPVAGKSSFQVGHLNPLKAVNDDIHSGHTADNISWISANGNRIQGSLTLNETRAMIKKIAANYERFKV